ncbi:MAG: hypothetical protein ABH834_06675 [Candidatus Altiarchaeota archaeon]
MVLKKTLDPAEAQRRQRLADLQRKSQALQAESQHPNQGRSPLPPPPLPLGEAERQSCAAGTNPLMPILSLPQPPTMPKEKRGELQMQTILSLRPRNTREML